MAVIHDPVTGEPIPRPASTHLSLRIHRDSLKALKWWVTHLDEGVPLASLVRSALEELADDIIDNYDVTNNSCGITSDELKSRIYRKLRYRDRQGRVRYADPATADVDV